MPEKVVADSTLEFYGIVLANKTCKKSKCIKRKILKNSFVCVRFKNSTSLVGTMILPLAIIGKTNV